jgi:hypothetical protein
MQTLDKQTDTFEGKNLNFKPSWINGMDFRTETDEFDFDHQRYLLRLRPSSPKVRNAQANLFQIYKERAAFQLQGIKEEFIEIAYEEQLSIYELSQKLILKRNLLLVLEDQENVLGQLLTNETQYAKNWLEKQRDIAELETAIKEEEAALKHLLPERYKLDWSDWISVEQILSFMTNEAVSGSFSLQNQKNNLDHLLIDGEMELEQAEQKKWLDFFQVEYRGPAENLWKERVSLTAAFQLPFSNNRKLKLEELALEKEVLKQKLAMQQHLNKHLAVKEINQIKTLAQNLADAKKMRENQNEKGQILTERIAQKADANPLFLLFVKEAALEDELNILKIELAIYQTYLDYLKLTEKLFEQPFSNYLANNKKN